MDALVFLFTLFFAPCPADATRVSSPYGYRTDPITKARRFHTGLDLAASEGAVVRAPWNAQVVYRWTHGPYGRTVVLETGELRLQFSHLSAWSVGRGELVRAGHEVGRVGQTGRATGPHLHLELRIGGKRRDPLRLLPRCAEW